jgi:hypothetical protein
MPINVTGATLAQTLNKAQTAQKKPRKSSPVHYPWSRVIGYETERDIITGRRTGIDDMTDDLGF